MSQACGGGGWGWRCCCGAVFGGGLQCVASVRGGWVRGWRCCCCGGGGALFWRGCLTRRCCPAVRSSSRLCQCPRWSAIRWADIAPGPSLPPRSRPAGVASTAAPAAPTASRTATLRATRPSTTWAGACTTRVWAPLRPLLGAWLCSAPACERVADPRHLGSAPHLDSCAVVSPQLSFPCSV